MQKIALIFLLVFVGCSVKQEKIYTTIKTPYVALSDAGVIKKGFGYKEIIIYRFGLEPIKILIKNSTICIQKSCMDKKAFIKQYLGEEYPSDFIDRILEKKRLNLSKKYLYKISKNKILYKDNKVFILIKNLNFN